MRKTVRLLLYLICYDLCCSLLSELQTGTSEDGQFISLCINGQGHMEGRRAEETTMTVSLLSFPPSHSVMCLSLPWEQERETSALVTNKHVEAAGKE